MIGTPGSDLFRPSVARDSEREPQSVGSYSFSTWKTPATLEPLLKLLIFLDYRIVGVELSDDLVDELQEHGGEWSDYLWL